MLSQEILQESDLEGLDGEALPDLQVDINLLQRRILCFLKMYLKHTSIYVTDRVMKSLYLEGVTKQWFM